MGGVTGYNQMNGSQILLPKQKKKLHEIKTVRVQNSVQVGFFIQLFLGHRKNMYIDTHILLISFTPLQAHATVLYYGTHW